MPFHNMSWLQYPSRVSLAVEDIIASQGVIARCMQVYVVLFIPVSLVTGLFNLTTFIQSRDRLGSLDVFLLDLTITGLLVTLLSLTVVSRPDYLATTNLGCAGLCLLSNICYFNGQYVQLAMLYAVLLRGPPSCLCTAMRGVRESVVGLAAIGGCALCSSLGVVALLGMSGELYKATLCQVDPLTSWPEYEIVKFGLGFGLALVLKLAVLTLLLARPVWHVAPSQGDSARLVVLVVILITFLCRLFYNIMLLRRASLKLQRDIGLPRDELLMNLAELVLFGESCAHALATLFLHEPCRRALLSLPQHLTRRCRAVGSSFSLEGMGRGAEPGTRSRHNSSEGVC